MGAAPWCSTADQPPCNLLAAQHAAALAPTLCVMTTLGWDTLMDSSGSRDRSYVFPGCTRWSMTLTATMAPFQRPRYTLPAPRTEGGAMGGWGNACASSCSSLLEARCNGTQRSPRFMPLQFHRALHHHSASLAHQRRLGPGARPAAGPQWGQTCRAQGEKGGGAQRLPCDHAHTSIPRAPSPPS